MGSIKNIFLQNKHISKMAKQYTMEEFEKMIDHQFSKHDVNSDAKLCKHEGEALMKEVHSKFSDKEWNQEAFEAAFTAADVDNDGHIDKAELHTFLLARATQKGM